jgi:hypothetical protein
MTLVSGELYSALLDAGMSADNAQAFAHALKDAKPIPVLLVPSLSLRDVFAAVALHALLAQPRQSLAVETAYELADAMLQARGKAAR